jgi:NitT/TauT family transport system substrate-binding protein
VPIVPINRRSFLGSAAAASAALGVAFSGDAARADDVVRVGTLPIDPALQCYYAQEKGFYSKAGITANIQSFTSGGAIAAGIAGGAIDIGNVDLISMVSAFARGLPFVIITPSAVYKESAQTYWFIVKQSSAIRSAKDFAGKIIATNGLRNINEILTDAWIDNNGGDSKTAKYVELPFPAMVPALEAGRIDAAVVTEPTLAITGEKYRVISMAHKNIAPTFMLAAWVAHRDWASKQPALARRYANVMYETAKWANANHEETARILSDVSTLSPAITQRMRRAYYGESASTALIQPMIDTCVRYGVIDKPLKASEMVWS